jgi:PAS domain S-box-containing protein
MAQTLTRRIIVRIVVPTGILLAVCLVTAEQIARSAVSTQHREHLVGQTQLHAARIELELAGAVRQLRGLAELLSLVGPLDETGEAALLRRLTREAPAWDALVLVRDGRRVAVSPDADAAGTPPPTGPGIPLAGAWRDGTGGTWYLVPLRDGSRRAGSLAGRIAPGRLHLAGPETRVHDGAGLLLDADGTVLARSGSPVADQRRLVEGTRSLRPDRSAALGDPVLWAARVPVTDTGWSLVRALPESDALARFDRIGTALIGALLLVLLAVTLGAAGIAAWTGRPLRALATASRRVADGSLDRLQSEGATTEVETLTDSLNEMIEQVRQRELSLAAMNDDLEGRVVERTERLAHRDRQWRSLIGTIPGAVYQVTVEAPRTVQFLSEAIADVTGHPPERFMGRDPLNLAELIDPEDRDIMEGALRRAAVSAGSYEVEYRLHHADGSIRWISERGQVQYEADGPTTIVGILRDVTDRRRTEQELIDSLAELANREQFLSELIRVAPFALALTSGESEDGSQRVELLNDRFTELFGYTTEHLGTLWDWFERCYPDADEKGAALHAWAERLEESERTGEATAPHSSWVVCLDGSRRYVTVSSVRLGEQRLSIIRDETDARLADERIRRERARLVDAIESLTVGFAMFDADDVLVIWNPRWKELYGFDDAWLTEARRTFPDVVREFTRRRPDIPPEKEAAFVERQLEARRKGRRNLQVEIDDHWYLVNDYRTSEGGFVSLNYEVTDLKRAEQRLLESQERFEFSLTAMGAFYWVEDRRAGTLTYLSDAFYERLGYTGDDRPVLGSEWTALMHPEDAPGATEAYARHLRGETGTFLHDARFRAKDGSYHWFRNIARVMNRDEDQRSPLVTGITLDVSDQKALEAEIIAARDLAEQATRAKSDFLANMSHEIRTPMNAIIGLSHLALQTGLDGTQRNYIEKVHGAADSLLGIINDILDFSKIEAGRLDIEQVDFALEDVLDNLTNMIGLRAQEKGIELMFDLAPELPTALVGDPLRLTQILVNIGSNAIKFTEQGEVVVRIEPAGRYADEADGSETIALRISVRDTGIGMDEEARARLFRAFSQADSSITRRYGGTGLGLIISRRLTELMGGEIQVDSTPGAGSTFSFTVHVGVQQQQPTLPVDEDADLAGTRVLVVDDNDTARDILCAMVESFGLRAEQAESAEQAVGLVRSADADDPFGLVLMDWRMPVRDGVEAAREIRDEADLTRPPAMVMVTAFGREADSLAAAGELFAAIVPKPVTPSALLDGVMKALGRGLLERRRGSARNEAAMEKLRGARILLVEDNDINQELAVDLLTNAGLSVAVAGDGAEALERLALERFDGVLMDCQMPVLDGYETTRRLRADPAFADLPVIAMTANAMAGDREKALAAGMNDHVAKPINVRVLFETLARWVTPAEPGAAPAPAAPPPETASIRTIPPIDGIDTTEGLARCHGDAALYLRTLRRFRDRQAQLLAELDVALADGDRATATRVAHTVKGLAGTLGATHLEPAARALEAACAGDGEVDVERRALGDALAALRPGLERLGEARTAPDDGAPLDADERGRLDTVLDELARLLEEADAFAGDRMREHADLLARGLPPGAAERIAGAIADWDFETATVLLGDARTRAAPPRSAGAAVTLDERSVSSVLSAIDRAIGESDPLAAELLTEHRDALGRAGGGRAVSALREALAEYDFDAAAEALDALRAAVQHLASAAHDADAATRTASPPQTPPKDTTA